MFSKLKEDIKAFRDRDPAARSDLEIYFLYPGFKAIRMHRRAHFYYKHGLMFLARYVSQKAARKTGIEIHPGAVIGKGLFIDHGMGVIIGETTVIGDDCTIYQGVTLGGTGKDTGKRHPTLGNNVMVSAGAKVLGSFTVGENSKIGAGSVVLEEVPPNSTVVGIPGRIVKCNDMRLPNADLDQIHLPDPVLNDINKLKEENEELKDMIIKLAKQLDKE